jgi:magnesium-transporting ATPase (P-type)
VAAIPEGLPPVITISLAIGVQLMARRNAIVRRLPAVETLGEVTVICTDKTGTLTRNEMTVRTVELADRRLNVTGVGYDPVGSFTLDGGTLQADDADLRALARAGLNCNDASLRKLNGQWQITGDPTEAALLTLAGKAGFDIENDGGRLPRVDAVPFESERRFMATVHTTVDGGCVLYVKGAPETVLDLCRDELKGGAQVSLAAERWVQAVEDVAARGERVLGLAMKSLDRCPDELTTETIGDDLTFLGFVGVADPPRSETPDALAACRAAGIQVKMITGDHAGTATAIAREIGLAETAATLTGQELDVLPAKALGRAARDVDVFARTNPEHKLWLVEALQAQGQVVAMTGDGVNDAPALKRADIGIAMGGKGTEAAREAAEMVLADDDFSTIVRAVEQGRVIYDNITKSILFLLPTSFAEALVIAAAVLFGYDLPMTPVQILWVNMITAVTLGIALAFERAEPGIMLRDPRVSQQPILSPLALWRTGYVGLLMLGGVALLFSTSVSGGASLEYARTLAVNALVVFEAVYVLASRYTDASVLNLKGLVGNPVVLISIVGVMSFQMLFTYTWPLNTWFQTAPLSGDAWTKIVVLGGALFLIVEVEKWVRRMVRAAAATRQQDPINLD